MAKPPTPSDAATCPAEPSLRQLAQAAMLVGLAALAGGVGTGSVLGPLIAVIAGIWLLAPATRRSPLGLEPRLMRLLVPATVAVGVLTPYMRGSAYWTIATLLSLAGAVAFFVTAHRPGVNRILLPIYAVVAVVVLMMAMPDGTLDVWFLHREAGKILVDGANPWTDLRVPNGAPTATEEFITGYPYPPLVLGTYGAIGRLVGEPRVVTIAAWLAVAGGLAWASRQRPSLLPAAWLLTVQPAWALTLWAGWTEPLSIALAVAALVAWRHTMSGSTLGTMLASKQYFVALAPQLLLASSLTRRVKAWVFGVAAALVAIALIWGPVNAFDALVVFHSRQPPRPDGLTLYGLTSALGLDFALPSLAAPVVAMAVSTWLGRSSSSIDGHWIRMAATLAVFFLLGSQAFANYWFVVFAFVVMAIIDAEAYEVSEPTGRP